MSSERILFAVLIWTLFCTVVGFASGYRCGQLDERDKWRAKGGGSHGE